MNTVYIEGSTTSININPLKSSSTAIIQCSFSFYTSRKPDGGRQWKGGGPGGLEALGGSYIIGAFQVQKKEVAWSRRLMGNP